MSVMMALDLFTKTYAKPGLKAGTSPCSLGRRDAARSGARKSKESWKQARAGRQNLPGRIRQNGVDARHDLDFIYEPGRATQ